MSKVKLLPFVHKRTLEVKQKEVNHLLEVNELIKEDKKYWREAFFKNVGKDHTSKLDKQASTVHK